VIHLEGSYQLDADPARYYANVPAAVVLAEDHYEQDHFTREPRNPDYFYRWLTWSWLLSAGSSVYGSRFFVLHPYSETGRLAFRNFYDQPGDAHTYTTALHGLDSMPRIRSYFSDRGIELWRYEPDDNRVSDPHSAGAVKMMRRGFEEFLIFHPNAQTAGREAAPTSAAAAMTLHLEDANNTFDVEWYRPSDGAVMRGTPVAGGKAVPLESPWPGADAVVRLTTSRPTS
jgi:hypothetical protein